jgi:hypothetical protein
VEKRHYLSGYHVEWKHRDKLKHQNGDITLDETELTTNTVSDTLVNSDMAKSENVSDTTVTAISENNEDIKVEIKKERGIRFLKTEEALRKVIQPIFSAKTSPTSLGEESIQELHPVAVVFGMIAFILASLATISFILALVFSEGWAALGWIAVAVVFGLATALFTLIAQPIFWSNHQGVPWFMWLPILITVISLYALIRILIDKLRVTP